MLPDVMAHLSWRHCARGRVIKKDQQETSLTFAQDLDIETDVYVGSRALPSVTNAFLDYAQVSLS